MSPWRRPGSKEEVANCVYKIYKLIIRPHPKQEDLYSSESSNAEMDPGLRQGDRETKRQCDGKRGLWRLKRFGREAKLLLPPPSSLSRITTRAVKQRFRYNYELPTFP